MNNLRILHLIRANDEYESEVVGQLSDTLNQKGISSQIALINEDGVTAHQRKLESDVQVLNGEIRLNSDLNKKLNALLKEQGINIVHTHDLKTLPLGTVAAKRIGKPIVHTQHKRENKKVFSLVRMFINKFIAASNDAKDYCLKQNPFKESKTSIIPDGVIKESDEKNRDEIREQLDIPPTSLVIGNRGALVRDQDHITLLKAFRKVIRKEVDAYLILAAHGSFRSEIEKVVRNFNLQERVRFMPVVKNDVEFYKAIDIYVSSAFCNNPSLFILKAVSFGLPVIATKVGSNPEIVIDSETGYLVPCGFPERIEMAIMRLKANPAFIPRMGEASQKHFEEKYSLEKTVTEYESLYKQLFKS